MDSTLENNFIKKLPTEILRLVFDNINSNKGKISCQSVCHAWKQEAKLSLLRKRAFKNRSRFNRMYRFLHLDQVEDDSLLLVKSVTIGDPKKASDIVTSVLNIAAGHFFIRLPLLEEIRIEDGTIDLPSFSQSNITKYILRGCSNFRKFTVNPKSLVTEDHRLSYLAILYSLRTVLEEVVLVDGDYSLYGGAYVFLMGFTNMSKLDVRGVTYFKKNEGCLRVLLERRGLSVLHDLPE